MPTDEIITGLRRSYATHDLTRQAAAHVITETSLVHKIAPYLGTFDDGLGESWLYVRWEELAGAVDEMPWSGSERGLARIACSLAGYGPDTISPSWLLSASLSGLDRRNSAAVLAALSLVLCK